MIMIIFIRFGWNLMKNAQGVVFRKSWNWKFTKCTEWSQTKLKESGIKSTLQICTVVPWVPNFIRFALRSAVFEIFCIISFPLTPMLKFQSAIKCLIFWQITKISITLYSPYILAKIPDVAHIPFFYPTGSKLSLFSQRFLRYGVIFKIAIFVHETWPLAEMPDVAHIPSFYPRGSKLSLFLLYGQRFSRYGLIFKFAIFGHET